MSSFSRYELRIRLRITGFFLSS